MNYTKALSLALISLMVYECYGAKKLTNPNAFFTNNTEYALAVVVEKQTGGTVTPVIIKAGKSGNVGVQGALRITVKVATKKMSSASIPNDLVIDNPQATVYSIGESGGMLVVL